MNAKKELTELEILKETSDTSKAQLVSGRATDVLNNELDLARKEIELISVVDTQSSSC